MLALERRAVDFVARHSLRFAFAAISLLALWIRLQSFDFESSDYTVFLQPWFEQLKAGGGLAALNQPIGNYNVPYITVLALLTYLPIPPLYSIKLVSILFDYVAAFAAARAVRLVVGNGKSGILGSFLTYATVLCLPTMILNSSYWAQCDSIYVAFLLLCLCSLLQERYTPAFIWFSVAFCFKLQAILLLPVLVVLYLVKRRFSAFNFLIVPAALLIGDLPALLAGREVRETLTIYLRQAEEYPELTLNYPNLYYFLMGDYELFAGVGVGLAVILCLLLAAYLLYRKWDIARTELVTLALWCALAWLFVLPSMHERYGLLTDLLAVQYFAIKRRKIWIPLLVNLSSMLSYTGFLFGYWVTDLMWFAVAKLFLLAVLAGDFLDGVRLSNAFSLEPNEE